MKENLITKLKRTPGLFRRESTRLRSGIIAEYYIDVRKAYGDPKTLELMSELIASILNKKTTCIVGSGYGGIPLATAVSLKSGKKLTLVRNEAKDHGTKKVVEGYQPNSKDCVAIIDDIVSSGSSLLKTREMLGPKIKVQGCYVVVKRENINLDIPLFHLLTTADLE